MDTGGGQHVITDEGRRVSEAHNRARVMIGGETGHRFIAIRLSDGQAEGDPLDVFDTFADATRHFPDHHAYLSINLYPMPPAEGTYWLALQRRLHASGFKLTDPVAPREVPSLGPGPSLPRPRPGRLIIPQLGIVPNRSDRRRSR